VQHDVMLGLMETLCTGVDSPFSLAVHLCLKYDRGALKQLQVDPASYCEDSRFTFISRSISRFKSDYFLYSYVKKYQKLHTGIDLKEVAVAAWFSSEVQCSVSNRRLSDVYSDQGSLPIDFIRLISRAQKKILNVIGSSPRFDEVTHGCRWGVGATASHRRGTAFDQKMTERLSCTRDALPYASLVLSHDLAWTEALIGFRPDGPCTPLVLRDSVVLGNTYETVPKDAFTDRSIGKEPSLNGFLQQGVGRFFRQRLLYKAGINLDDQTINQGYAQRAYNDDLATLDLSSASDTICRALVALLLPPDWLLYLDSIRSPFTLIEGRWVFLSKFSSMGNAFTFELESMVFWAIIDSVVDEYRTECGSGVLSRVVSVYGDDIIVNACYAQQSIRALNFFGFSVNRSKSFVEGYFYESCGRHYCIGEDVTPCFQKEELSSEESIVRAYNRLYRNRFLLRLPRIRWQLLKLLWNAYPSDSRPLVPVGYEADVGFLTDRSKFAWNPNGFTWCLVLRTEHQIYLPGIPLALYAYKLRRPLTTSPHPRGWDDVAKTVMSRALVRTKIWLSACRD
jgi:hypothetical protein